MSVFWLKHGTPFFLFCFLSTVAAETETLSPHDPCKESSCDAIHGPSIRFPFRLKGRQPQWCGYNNSSWFDVYCDDSNQTVLDLELPFSHKTLVKSINYTSQDITVSYYSPEQLCFDHKQIANFDISASPFRFNDVLGEYALFNCSGTSHRHTDTANIITSGNFSCLNVPGFEVIAVNSGSLVVWTPLLSCTRIQSLVLLPNSLFNSYNDAGLHWFQPDCKNCERKGGQCKAKENKSEHEFECMGISTPKGSSKGKVIADAKDVFLGWERLQNIALGIAKGIEYLHQGCDKQILHFDIKPHNVLLDDNFTPKISDFGLSKLCSKDKSKVSMSNARGTVGYIAPEVFSRNFGNVSYKSDVYSYGMLLLEMVGGRKITDVTDENSSHVNYPQWIYNLLENNEDMKIHIEGEEDTRVAKKLSIVGLWCIQWHPVNRPTMKAVVQILEGNGEKLEMPPNPFASASATRASARFGTGRLNLELDVISEIE